MMKVTDERGQQVEHRVLARRDVLVAGPHDLRGLGHGLLGRRQRVVGLERQRRGPAPPDAADLHGDHGTGPRSTQVRRGPSCRDRPPAATAARDAPAGSSRRVSAPRVPARRSRACPPARHALPPPPRPRRPPRRPRRRAAAPRRRRPGRRAAASLHAVPRPPAAGRPIVLSLVVRHPRRDEDVVLDQRERRHVGSRSESARARRRSRRSPPPSPGRRRCPRRSPPARARAPGRPRPRRRRSRRRRPPRPAPPPRNPRRGSPAGAARARRWRPARAPPACRPRTVLEPRADADAGPVVHDHPGAEQHVVGQLNAVSQQQARRPVRGMQHARPPRCARSPPASAAAARARAPRAGPRAAPERGSPPSRTRSRKCRHSIRSGSSFETRGLKMSPERAMYSP